MSARAAVFLDRDGVINRNCFYDDTKEWESPRRPDQLALVSQAAGAMRRLKDAGYLLLMVSNQPNYAKGKNSLDELAAVHARLEELLAREGVALDGHRYCFHHPKGIVASHAVACACRKPEPGMVLDLAAFFAVDPVASWMLGDRLSDIECARRAGLRGIFIAPASSPDIERAKAMGAVAVAEDLAAAAGLILNVG